MKKVLFSVMFLCLTAAVFSQEAKKELTAAEKEELRSKHNSSLQFTNSNKSTNGTSNVKYTNIKEESESNIKVTKVKYYNGTQDSLYKEFKYIKPE